MESVGLGEDFMPEPAEIASDPRVYRSLEVGDIDEAHDYLAELRKADWLNQLAYEQCPDTDLSPRLCVDLDRIVVDPQSRRGNERKLMPNNRTGPEPRTPPPSPSVSAWAPSRGTSPRVTGLPTRPRGVPRQPSPSGVSASHRNRPGVANRSSGSARRFFTPDEE